MLAEQGDFKVLKNPGRILIIHSRYKQSGGETSVVQNELTLLKEYGCDIRVLYFDNRKYTAINVLFMPFNVFSFFKVLAACLQYKPRLVHIHNLHFAASPAIIWAIKLLRIPIIKTLHNYRLLCPTASLFSREKLYLNSLNKSFPWEAVKQKVYKDSFILTFWLAFTIWFHKNLGTWKNVNRYVVFTEQGRNLFLNSNLGLKRDQIVIKPNFSCKNLQPPEKRSNTFLYIGRLSQEKGITLLLNAFADNGLKLTIIGDGPYCKEVEEAMQRNPLINWKGYQDRDAISLELKKCAALIFPSICYEGMPLTIIEAFASGTPVIASRLGAMEKMVRHKTNGLLFEAGNLTDLNAQLHNWNNYTAAEKNKYYKNAGKMYEDKYTPERNLWALFSIYHSAISKRKISRDIPKYSHDKMQKDLLPEDYQGTSWPSA